MTYKRIRSTLVVLVCLGLLSAGVAADDIDEAKRVVRESKAGEVNVYRQAKILADLAWPDGSGTDPVVSAVARAELVGYGDYALPAMAARMREVDSLYSADIASAVAETRLVVTAGLPSEYVPFFYDALWYGSVDAQRLAMLQMAIYGYLPAMLPTIDAAVEHPQLKATALRTLPRMGTDKSRHYLGEVLNEADPRYVRLAAEALVAIGGRGMETLRDATLSENVAIRSAAIDALVPHSSVDDLTTLYEYIAKFEKDDPERVDLVMQRAVQLESLLERAQQGELGEAGENY